MENQIDAARLKINPKLKTEAELFKWLLASLLFDKRAPEQAAAKAYQRLIDAGIISLDTMASTAWDDLAELLGPGHRARHDYSKATQLLEVSKALKEHYRSMRALLSTTVSAHDLEQRLAKLSGVDATTIDTFVGEIAPVWFGGGNHRDLESAKSAAEILKKHGYQAYIIGGAVRDILLGKRPKDFDLATNATPEQIAQINEFNAKYKDTAQAYGVTRVKFDHQGDTVGLEIATFRRDVDPHLGRKATRVQYATLEDDVLRRDFTINALAMDPDNGEVVDLIGGRGDLQAKIVRFIGTPKERIAEDPLRIMRAIRFRNHLGFEYEQETDLAIERAVREGAVEAIAVDRLRDELTRLLVHPSRRQSVQDLDNFGILERVLPDVTAGKATKQPPQYHAEGTVWEHELLILGYLPTHPSRRLAWAALLHDIGKAHTIKLPANSHERIRFDRHYTVGAELARKILERLKFSNRDVAEISWMIHYHMAIDDLPQMRPSHRRQMLGHPAFEDLLELHRADAAASWRPNQPHGVKPKFAQLERLWHEYQSTAPELRQPSLKRDLGIDGHWLAKNFASDFTLTGPLIGKVLRELEEMYQDQGQTDPNVYLAQARRLLQGSTKS